MTAKCSDCRSEASLAETLLPGIRFVLSNRELKLRVADLLICAQQKKKKKRFAQNVELYAFWFFSTQWVDANEGGDARKTTLCTYMCVSFLSDATTHVLHYILLCSFLTPTIKACETTPNVLVGDSLQEGYTQGVLFVVVFLLLSI